MRPLLPLILAGLLAAPGFGFAQQRWGANGCRQLPAQPQQLEWRTDPNDADHIYLWQNGLCVGGWSYLRRVYAPFNPHTLQWGAEQDCAPVSVPSRAKPDGDRGAIPKEMPQPCKCGCHGDCSSKCHCDKEECEKDCGCQKPKEPVFEQLPVMPKEMMPGEVLDNGTSNFGLDLKRMHDECPNCACNDCKCDGGKDNCQCHYTFRDHRGCPLSREKAFQFLANGVPDDTDFLRLTWVGDKSVAAKMLADLNAPGPLQPWGSKVCFQTYASVDDPMLKDTADGKPLGAAAGVMVQSPAGLPLWYAANYDPQALASGLLLADARRRDPNWDPAKWPALAIEPHPASPANPTAPVAGQTDVVTKCVGFCQNNWGWLAGAGAAAYLLRRKRA